jgi:hypothetical protein
MIVLALACGVDTPAQIDAAGDSGDDSDGTDTAAVADEARVLAQIGLIDATAGWQDGATLSYTVDGIAVAPAMTLGFFTEDFILGLDPEGWCQWTGALSLTEQPSTGDYWLTFTVGLTLIETDCTDDWAGGDPSAGLADSQMTLGLAAFDPLQQAELAESLSEYEGRLYAVYLLGGKLSEPAAVAYGTVAAMEGDAMVIHEGSVQLLPIQDGIPDGVLRWYGTHTFSAGTFQSVW